MEKTIALIKNAIIFNIIVGSSAEEMAALFDCEAIEVTNETGRAYIGYGIINGVFEKPSFDGPHVEEEPAIIE
jgi:hypothetical protein